MSPACISHIVSKVRKRPEALGERIRLEAEKALRDEELAIFVETKLLNGEVIQRADDIRKDFYASKGI